MKAGNLRHYVEILKLVETVDDLGEPVKSYTHYAYTFAEIRPLLGRENFAEKQVSSEQTHKIKMRYIAGVTATMKVRFGDQFYGLIGYPINWQERNIFLTFNAEEIYDRDTIPVIDITCTDSVGGDDGTEYNLDGKWKNDCTIFKGV